jgi:hypothetical protein
MTLAICLQCGHEKLGAFTPCPACGYDPSGDNLAEAKALLLSDHHATADELRAASAMIKEGKEVPFSRSVIDRIVAELAKAPRSAKMPIGCAILMWSPIGFVLLLGLLEVITLWMRR